MKLIQKTFLVAFVAAVNATQAAILVTNLGENSPAFSVVANDSWYAGKFTNTSTDYLLESISVDVGPTYNSGD